MTEPLSAATLHEAAGRTGALPSAIKPVSPTFRVWGPAFPVRCPPGDNLWIHRAIYAAEPGDVLVVDVGGGHEFGPQPAVCDDDGRYHFRVRKGSRHSRS